MQERQSIVEDARVREAREARPAPLLAKHEPSPFEILNPGGRAPALLTCDHASNRVPEALGSLGLPRAKLLEHIGWDAGAAEVTRRLSQRLDAIALLSRYSRLVIDCNRKPGAPSSIPELSHGTVVPGNRGLTAAKAEQRRQEIFQPYHEAISKMLARLGSGGRRPAYLAIHSFTPSLNGVSRPWHLSVLWDRDSRIATPLIAALRTRHGLTIGDNTPYSGRTHFDFSNEFHATRAGLPNALIEIREDLIRDEAGLARICGILGEALSTILANPATGCEEP